MKRETVYKEETAAVYFTISTVFTSCPHKILHIYFNPLALRWYTSSLVEVCLVLMIVWCLIQISTTWNLVYCMKMTVIL